MTKNNLNNITELMCISDMKSNDPGKKWGSLTPQAKRIRLQHMRCALESVLDDKRVSIEKGKLRLRK